MNNEIICNKYGKFFILDQIRNCPPVIEIKFGNQIIECFPCVILDTGEYFGTKDMLEYLNEVDWCYYCDKHHTGLYCTAPIEFKRT